MRLGGALAPFRAETVAELPAVAAAFDTYGLSAILAPNRIGEMDDDEAAKFGEEARALGMVVGESWFNTNLLNTDPGIRAARVEALRLMIRKTVVMGCRSACMPVGSVDASDHPLAPHPYMFTDACRSEFRELMLRVLDGLELGATKLLVEPWNTSFFYQPEDIREFMSTIGHPSFGVHLDQMNMVNQQHYFRTTELINTTFDLLEGYIGSVHFKDIHWDPAHKFLKFDEVRIGEGTLDYHTYLRRLTALDPDTTGFCEHLPAEGDYAVNFARLHRLAAEVGAPFIQRVPAVPA
jgi:sugar phosphate isomerase/epimerase